MGSLTTLSLGFYALLACTHCFKGSEVLMQAITFSQRELYSPAVSFGLPGFLSQSRVPLFKA